MPLETKTCFPTAFDAGEAFTYKTSHADYPASEHAAVLSIQTGSGGVAINSINDDDCFSFTVGTTDTEAVAPGDHLWAIVVTISGTNKTTIERGVVSIYESVAVDHVPTASETMLADCEAAITFLNTNKFSSTNFNGQSVTYADIGSLMRDRTRLQAEVLNERRKRFARFAAPVTSPGITFNAL